MKKTLLSALAALTLSSLSASASSDVKFYQDANGQVFTKPAEGRKLIDIPKKETSWHSHADKLKFSSLAYLGYTYNDYKSDTPTMNYQANKSNFEIRRGYFQVKAYLLDDPKSYYRITLDVHQNAADDLVVRAKYAYLYLNNILPSTGVELGLVHRPWHDYEEHNAWYYRSIAKVLTEDSNGAHLSNSADFGVNFKTKTQYFDSEFGVFNGEGYHSDFNDDSNDDAGTGMSFEWRTTAHILGVNGKDKQTTKTYFDVSFFGQYNKKHKTSASGIAGQYDDLVFGGVHTVFNMPSFLLSAQYIKSQDTADNGTYVSAQAGSGYSVNGEVRFGAEKAFRVLARYDSWTPEELLGSDEKENKSYLAGFAWDQNKNVQWVANVTVTDNENGSSRQKYNGNAYMITAEVKF
jgi:hypothetical protein